MLILIIGFLSGILSGLAIGGGTLLVPALIFFIGTSQHMAQGISLASFLPTALVAVITHYRAGNVKFKLASLLMIGSITGAIIGATIASRFSPEVLKKIFGVFLILMGFYEYFGKAKLTHHADKLREN